MSSRKALSFTRPIACAIALFTCGSAFGASDTLSVTATLRPIASLSVLQNLGFGDITVGQTATGSVTLRPDGTLVISGSGLSAGSNTSPQPGQIEIAGEQGAAIDVSCDSALIANLINETIPVSINVAAVISDTGSPCAGLETPVLTVSQPVDSFSIFVGGLIDSNDLTSITSFEEFSSQLNAGVHAVFQAVYQ